MTKREVNISFSISLATTAVALCAIIYNWSGYPFYPMKATTPGPEEEISSIAFYENTAIEAVYGKNAGYKREQSVDISGATWVISGASYGEDEPTHITSTAGRNTLFYDAIWMGDNILPYNTNYAGMAYSAEYNSMKEHFDGSLIWNMAIFSTTTFTDVTDFGLFYHYTTNNLGIKPFYKVAGTTDWLPLVGYSGSYEVYSYQNGLTIYEDAGSTYNATEVTDEYIDYAGPYTRYYDGACYYNDQSGQYQNLVGKEVYLGFLIGASQAYLMDIQIDGIIVNRHDSAMKFMNSLNDRTICGTGTITDKNIKMCFNLFDKAFDSALASSSDVEDLGEYVINHTKYPNLAEYDYYSQYQYLKSKLA